MMNIIIPTTIRSLKALIAHIRILISKKPSAKDVLATKSLFMDLAKERTEKNADLRARIIPIDIFLKLLVEAEAREENRKIDCGKGQDCSHCCKSNLITLYPFEVQEIIRFLNTKPRDLIERLMTNKNQTDDFNGGCNFLSPEGYCDIYEHRPLVCRMFWAKNKEECKSWPIHEEKVIIMKKFQANKIIKPESWGQFRENSLFEEILEAIGINAIERYEINELFFSIFTNKESFASWSDGKPFKNDLSIEQKMQIIMNNFYK